MLPKSVLRWSDLAVRPRGRPPRRAAGCGPPGCPAGARSGGRAGRSARGSGAPEPPKSSRCSEPPGRSTRATSRRAPRFTSASRWWNMKEENTRSNDASGRAGHRRSPPARSPRRRPAGPWRGLGPGPGGRGPGPPHRGRARGRSHLDGQGSGAAADVQHALAGREARPAPPIPQALPLHPGGGAAGRRREAARHAPPRGGIDAAASPVCRSRSC